MKVRYLKTDNAVFSSPSLLLMSRTSPDATTLSVNDGAVESERVLLFCGSHDSHVHCWDTTNEGVSLWKTSLDSEVYSIPTPSILSNNVPPPPPPLTADSHLSSHSHLHTNTSTSVICVASSAGVVYILDSTTGSVSGSLKLPGQVFSSPAMSDNLIVVGCRDNYLYCIECAYCFK